MNASKNNPDINKANDPFNVPVPAPDQDSAKDVLDDDDLHEVQVDDDINEPDADNTIVYEKDESDIENLNKSDNNEDENENNRKPII